MNDPREVTSSGDPVVKPASNQPEPQSVAEQLEQRPQPPAASGADAALEQAGTHPLGTAVGAVGGAVTGAVIGIAAGPVGSLAGAVAGAVGGAILGSGAGAAPAGGPGVPSEAADAARKNGDDPTGQPPP